MISRTKWIPLALAGGVAVTRFIFRSHDLYDIDSVNFALAIGRFDPRVHQPHPPGYFLYVCLGRLLNHVLHDPNLAFVILSILSSCAAVIVIYKLALDWFGSSAAAFAGILFLLSPLVWFHGTVALTYMVEAFFSAFLGYFCWRMENGDGALAPLAAIILGISAGVRPSSLLFLAPLFFYALRRAPLKRIFGAVLALLVTLAAWSVPMVASSGGAKAYYDALSSLWIMVPSKSTIFNSSPINSVARAFTIIFIYFLCFGAASLAPLAALGRAERIDRRKAVFTAVWTLPALCFFVFGYLKFVNSGYLLLLFAPACIWLGFWMSEWYRSARWKKSLKLNALGAGAVANILIFLISPFYCSYRSVRQFEAELSGIRAVLPQLAPAHDTLIVGFDSHFLGYRHAGYYFPDYLTVAYPAAHLKEGIRIFTMHERDTQLLPALPSGSYSRFILFPLPDNGPDYHAYLAKVEARLPRQGLTIVNASGNEFVTGPAADLPLLFPDLAHRP